MLGSLENIMINSNIEKVIDCAQKIVESHNTTWDSANIEDSLLRLLKDSLHCVVLLNALLGRNNSIEDKDIIQDLINFLPPLKNELNFISLLVKYNESFANLFPVYKDSKIVKLSVLTNMPEKISEYTTWQKPSTIKDCVAHNPLVYRYLNLNFKSNSLIIKTALKNTVVYEKNEGDIKYGVFFDLPQEAQNNKHNILLALKSYPAIYHLLDSRQKEDVDIVIAACKSIFYDVDGCYYSKSNDVIPYISDNFFKDVNNIIWVLKAFADNLENIKQNVDLTMSCFNTFLNKACSLNMSFNIFSKTHNLQSYFNDLLESHRSKIYNDNLNPTGLEHDAIKFFSLNLKGINKSFNNFLLYQKLDEKLPMCKESNKVSKI